MALTMKNTQELTTEEVIRTVIQPLETASQILASGPTVIDSPTGDPVKIPRLTTRGTAPQWYAENELIGENEPDFDEITLLPTILKSVKVLHRFSNELARHSVVPISTIMQSSLVTQVGQELDKAFFSGVGTVDGNGNRGVIGLANQSGIQANPLTTTSAALTVSTMIDSLYKFTVAEIHDFSKVKLFVPNATYLTMQKLVDSTGRPLLVPDVQASQQVFRLQGIPVIPTARLAAGTGLLVDFANVVVARDLRPTLKVLDEFYANYDALGLRVVTRFDIGLLHPEAVVKLTIT